MSYNPVPPNEIPEVQAFENAKQALEQFKAANAGVLEAFAWYAREYNDKLEAADKAVRARGASCGDFDYYQKATKIDAAALYTALGREEFVAAGGTVKMVAEYKIDAKRLEQAVATKKIDPALAAEVTRVEARYKTPKPVSL